MSVLTKNGEVYADAIGYAVSRLLSFWEIMEAVVVEAIELRRSLIKQHGLSEW